MLPCLNARSPSLPHDRPRTPHRVLLLSFPLTRCVPLIEHGHYLLDCDVKLRMYSDQKTAKRYLFLFQRAILVCKQRIFGYGFLYSMNVRDFELSEELVKGKRLGIRMSATLSSATVFDCTLLFKSEAQRDHWAEALETAKAAAVREQLKPMGRQGHRFVVHSFSETTTCDQCQFLLWGLIDQGLQCRSCGFAAHRHCVEQVRPGQARERERRKGEDG